MLINKIKAMIMTTFIIALITTIIYVILNTSYYLGIYILKQSIVVMLLKIAAITAIGLTVFAIILTLSIAIFLWIAEPIVMTGKKI